MRRTATALAAIIALATAACGDGGAFQGTTSTTQVIGSTEAPTTSGAAASTTAATTTSTTTSTSTTTTTIVTPTLGPPPLPLEFRPDGLNIVGFGATPEDAIAIVSAYLGSAPTSDSGWGPAWGDYGACPGTEYRQVAFGGLILKFTDADIFQPAGTRQFFAWSYDGNPPSIAFGALDVGTTVADIQALYPAAMVFPGDELFGPTFRVEGTGGEQLWGTLTGTGPADTVLFLTGGWGCGE